jgi:hypothetical protein
VHEFNPDRLIAGSFESVPGTLFGVAGARAWSDASKVNAGSRLVLNQYECGAVRRLRRRVCQQRP